MNISGQKILHALQYYQQRGYWLIDVPFTVDLDIINLTMPEQCSALEHQFNKYYVGSAEQSFLQLIKNGEYMEEGLYMALTPCHRYEQADSTHFEIFLKLELFSIEHRYQILWDDAFGFFKQYLGIRTIINDDVRISDETGFDIVSLQNDIELGSYGTRTVVINGKEVTYSFGTGIAEPRLSYCVELEPSIQL